MHIYFQPFRYHIKNNLRGLGRGGRVSKFTRQMDVWICLFDLRVFPKDRFVYCFLSSFLNDMNASNMF